MTVAPKSRWYQFSLRTMLLVTVIVALTVGWWVDRAMRSEIQRRTTDEIKRAEKVQRDFHHAEKQLVLARDGLEAQQRTIDYLKSQVPNSSAPAPRLPKE